VASIGINYIRHTLVTVVPSVTTQRSNNMTPQELFNKLTDPKSFSISKDAIAMHVLHRFHPLEYDNTDNYIHDLRKTTWVSGGLGLVYYGEAAAMLADQAWRDDLDEYLELCYDSTDTYPSVKGLDLLVIEALDYWCDILAEIAEQIIDDATDGSTVTTME